MTYQVLLQPVSNNGYQATALALPDCVGTGATREEALANIKATLAKRLSQGEIVTVEVDEPEHPWLKWFGMLKDDPTFNDFVADMEAYRRELAEAEEKGGDLSSRH